MARVLTIEDDPTIQALLRAQLQQHGHEVLEADAGDRGLELVRAERPDAVLLDLGLPGLHGTVVLGELKRDPATAGIPVIVVSAWGEGHAATTALARGASAVLRKPFAADDLFALLDETVGAAT